MTTRRRPRLHNLGHWCSFIKGISLLHLADSALAVKTASNYLILHDELIQLFLQIIVLESKEVSMVSKRLHLLLIALTGLHLRFVARTKGLKLSGQRHQLVIQIYECSLCSAHISLEILGSATFGLILPTKLSLRLLKKSIFLVYILNVFLGKTRFILDSALLRAKNFKFCPCIPKLYIPMMQLIFKACHLIF